MHGAVIETSIGALGLGFSSEGLSRLFLPELDDDDGARMRALLKRHGFSVVRDAPHPHWSERITRHLAGDDVVFDDLPIDLSRVTPFARKVYDAARAIPRGRTATYAEIAQRIGTKSARAVGVALGKNPIAIVVPCHRVIGANGCGGFSAPGGTSTKATLLAIEGGSLGDPEHRLARSHLVRADAKLAPFVRRIPCTLPVTPKGALFRTLARAIAGQQLSIKAAATIFGRLEARIGGFDDKAPARILMIEKERLREVGLSNAKVEAVRDLARHVEEGLLALDRLPRAPDEVVVSELTRVRGIGRWTVEMLLIFDFGRPDVLPVDDLGLRRGAQKVWGLRSLPDAATIEKRAEAWRPFRSIGSFYLWRSLEVT